MKENIMSVEIIILIVFTVLVGVVILEITAKNVYQKINVEVTDLEVQAVPNSNGHDITVSFTIRNHSQFPIKITGVTVQLACYTFPICTAYGGCIFNTYCRDVSLTPSSNVIINPNESNRLVLHTTYGGTDIRDKVVVKILVVSETNEGVSQELEYVVKPNIGT